MVGSKPLGFFCPGDFRLLELYCATVTKALEATAEVVKEPVGSERFGRLAQHAASLTLNVCRLASRLRIGPQATYARQSRIHDEAGAGATVHELLGGRAVRM